MGLSTNDIQALILKPNTGTDSSTGGAPYMSAADRALRSGASIFDVAAANSGSNSSDKAKEDDLLAQGDDATAQANDAQNNGSWTDRCKNLGAQAVSFTQAGVAKMAAVMGLGTQSAEQIQAGARTIEGLNTEIEHNMAQVEDLQAQREALESEPPAEEPAPAPAPAESDDNPGSLLAPSSEAAPEKGSGTNGNEAEIASLDRRIGSLTSQTSTNNKQIKTTSKSINSTKSKIDALVAGAAAQKTTTDTAVAAGTQTDKTAATVGTITTIAGGVTSAVGATMIAFVPTSVPGAVVSATGAGVTAVGQGISTAAAAANNDLAATQASANSLGAATETTASKIVAANAAAKAAAAKA